jgi:hypothetical protein
MTDQQLTFDGPGLSHRDDPETSREAAATVTSRTRRAMLSAFIDGAELTDDEAGLRAGIGNYSQRRRCSELRSLGLIEPTGAVRATEGGGRGLVCRITPAGRRAITSGAEDL